MGALEQLVSTLTSHGIDPTAFLTDAQGTVNKLVELYKENTKAASAATVEAKEAAIKQFKEAAENDEEAKALAQEFRSAVFAALDTIMDNPAAIMLSTEHIRNASKALTAERDYNLGNVTPTETSKATMSRDECERIKDGLMALSTLGATLPDNLFKEHKLPRKPGSRTTNPVRNKRMIFIWNGTVLPLNTTTVDVAHDYVSDYKKNIVVRWQDIVKTLNDKYPGGWSNAHWRLSYPTGELEGMPGSLARDKQLIDVPVSDASEEEE